MGTAKQPGENRGIDELLRKISLRIDEDNAFAEAQFCDALRASKAKARDRDQLIENLLMRRLDIVARYGIVLVPHFESADDFSDLLQRFVTEGVFSGKVRPPASWSFAAKGRVSYWRGKALERQRQAASEKSAKTPTVAKDSRATINQWLKKHQLSHVEGSRKLAVGETVLSALKRGTAVSDGRCAPSTVRRVAEGIGCDPALLDPNYASDLI